MKKKKKKTYRSLNVNLCVAVVVPAFFQRYAKYLPAHGYAASCLGINVLCDGVDDDVALGLEVAEEEADLGVRLPRAWEEGAELVEGLDGCKRRREEEVVLQDVGFGWCHFVLFCSI